MQGLGDRLAPLRQAQTAGSCTASTAVRFLAAVTGVAGLINIAWGFMPDPHGLPAAAARFSPLNFGPPGRLFHLSFGVGLLIAAGGLRRRKKYAWWVIFAACAATFVYRVLQADWPAGVLAAAMAAGLLRTRRAFIAPSGRPAVYGGLRVWALLMGAALFLAVIGLRTPLPGGEAQTVGLQFTHALSMLFFYDPLQPEAGGSEVLSLSTAIYILAAAAWGYLLLMLGLPLPPPPPNFVEDRDRARSIVQAHGRSSQAHLALLSDKRYFFTPGGSLVAYGVSGRVAVTLGDPIGPTEDIPKAINAFCEFCAHSDWMPAFCLVGGDHLDAYRQAGFDSLCMGHEGVVDLGSFTLRGNAVKSLRKRYNRLSAAGYRVEIIDPPIPGEIVNRLRRISDEWLEMAATAEKRFFLAWFDNEYVSGERIAVVRSPEGIICAFTNLVPEYQLNEISIDLMRRRRRVESGTMDFLFVSLLLWARDQGYDSFNLGLSPLFGVGERPGRSLLERGIRYFYRYGNFYDFKGLNGFKIKFRPDWQPQYTLFPGLPSLAPIGLAMARVNAGENETMYEYFRPRPKTTTQPEAEDRPWLLTDTQGD